MFRLLCVLWVTGKALDEQAKTRLGGAGRGRGQARGTLERGRAVPWCVSCCQQHFLSNLYSC